LPSQLRRPFKTSFWFALGRKKVVRQGKLPSSPLFGNSQVTMALTPAKAMEAFHHVVNDVFQVQKEGPFYKALVK